VTVSFSRRTQLRLFVQRNASLYEISYFNCRCFFAPLVLSATGYLSSNEMSGWLWTVKMKALQQQLSWPIWSHYRGICLARLWKTI